MRDISDLNFVNEKVSFQGPANGRSPWMPVGLNGQVTVVRLVNGGIPGISTNEKTPRFEI